MTKEEILYNLIDFAMSKKKKTPKEMIEKLKEVSDLYDKL